MNILFVSFSDHTHPFLLGIYLGVELLSHRVALDLAFINVPVFQTNSTKFTFPRAMCESSKTYLHLIISKLLNFNYPKEYELGTSLVEQWLRICLPM